MPPHRFLPPIQREEGPGVRVRGVAAPEIGGDEARDGRGGAGVREQDLLVDFGAGHGDDEGILAAEGGGQCVERGGAGAGEQVVWDGDLVGGGGVGGFGGGAGEHAGGEGGDGEEGAQDGGPEVAVGADDGDFVEGHGGGLDCVCRLPEIDGES